MRSSFILAIGTASLMSSVAFAQTVEPKFAPTATNVTTTKWMTEEATGQWRASKMIGLNVYNSVSEKIGTISELIVDQSGKLEAVVVGARGFLGIGERDVAVPYSQIRVVVSAGGFLRHRHSLDDDWGCKHSQPELGKHTFLSGPRAPQHVGGSAQGRAGVQILPLNRFN
jgi:sporulation protein YlmC with PRC-barrel domain